MSVTITMASEPYEHLALRQEGDALWVTMNRPDSLNALNRRLTAELRDLFVNLYWRRDVRVVVLAGAGAAFCAGLDLKERSDSNGQRRIADGLDSQRSIAEIVIAMRRCPQPIIACVDGAAAGGGFALALASDVRIVTPRTRMNAAFIRIGLSACDIGVSYFLPRLVGVSVASELMLTGRFINAERALRVGLVSDVVADDRLAEAAQVYLKDMLTTSPLGLRMTKECLNMSVDAGSLEAAIAMEDRNQILCAQTQDFPEGIRAFLEKRDPNYQDR